MMRSVSTTFLSDRMDDARFYKSVLLLTVCGLALRAWGLSSQQLSNDDITVAVSAMNYLERGHLGPTMWYHPPLRNILVYATLSLGIGVWGLKLNSLLLGSLSVPLLALVTRRITGSGTVALLAAFFLMTDALHIDFSRQAVQEVYMMFFSLLGILLCLRSTEAPGPVMVFFGAVSFGLGIASKWYVAFPLAATVLYLLYSVITEPGAGGRQRTFRITFILFTFATVPAAVYLLTYIPWFGRGHALTDWFALQKGMFWEAMMHRGYNPYTLELAREAYLWFLRPAVYPDFTYGESGPGVLLGIGNPLVWLLTIPSVLYVAVQAVRERAVEKYFLAGLFCLSYLPLALTKRPLWVHTAFSVIPFAFMAVAHALLDMTKMKPGRMRPLLVYLLIVALVSVPLYLLATGKGFAMPVFKPLFEMYRPSFER